ncbi:MAG: polyribonucleotide nucleotidyltransferase, partial [Helicobacter sp.]|nr:polyribonucleotide nucleotidyltransferase [Helicobacter sp.]
MKKTIETKTHKETFSLDEVAKQANGSVLMQVGGSIVLATICSDFASSSLGDFLPLTVQYIEKSYAAGKIPSGFFKRESRPSEFETLTSRIIDRTLRPLFPKGFYYPTQITVLVLSSDKQTDLQTLALNAASAALFVSNIPISQPACAVRIGRVHGNLCLNPDTATLNQSTLDLFVSGVHDNLLMIEMRSIAQGDKTSEIPENELMEILDFAKNEIAQKSALYVQNLAPYAKQKVQIALYNDINSPEIYDFIAQNYREPVYTALQAMAKSERASELTAVLESILADAHVVAQGWERESVDAMLQKYKKHAVRAMILDSKKRADGRGLRDVRAIDIHTNFLPCVHSSVLFTRGQTQALVTATIGSDSDAQSYELLSDKMGQKEHFMLHYNFPPFCVGEVGSIGSPGRRELGHGNLARRALEPSLVSKDAQTVRIVSEILESNGSSSMASVCGGSLALAAAGIPIHGLIAGVAMGLVTEDENYAILTDIMGLEDHDGDMDFKVAGSRNGITALQMDIKLGGLRMHILNEALLQAKEARDMILDIMENACKEIVLNDQILPSTLIFSIPPSKMVDVIGQAGKTIREIIEKFSVAIDLNKEIGEIKLIGSNKNDVNAAKDYIQTLVAGSAKPLVKELYNVGEQYMGKVKK